MNISELVNNYHFSGEWHIHTNYTDGKNSIDDYCQKAKELNIPLLAFTEHVRKDLSYNFNDFVSEIKVARKLYPDIHIIIGCEAKVLETGELDISPDVLNKCEYRLFAYHSFPRNIDTYKNTLIKIVNSPNNHCWAHPGLFLKKHSNYYIPMSLLNKIFSSINKLDKYIEFNLKYCLPPTEWLLQALNLSVKIVWGGDIHSVEQMESVNNTKSSWLKITGIEGLTLRNIGRLETFLKNM